jgi:hypothetical protein
MGSAVRGALADLTLERGRVAFDDMGFGFRLDLEDLEVVDGYDPLMFARAVKTAPELQLLERATRLNDSLEQLVDSELVFRHGEPPVPPTLLRRFGAERRRLERGRVEHEAEDRLVRAA